MSVPDANKADQRHARPVCPWRAGAPWCVCVCAFASSTRLLPLAKGLHCRRSSYFTQRFLNISNASRGPQLQSCAYSVST